MTLFLAKLVVRHIDSQNMVETKIINLTVLLCLDCRVLAKTKEDTVFFITLESSLFGLIETHYNFYFKIWFSQQIKSPLAS